MPVLPMFRRLLAALCLMVLPALVAAQPSTAFVKRLSDVEALAAKLVQSVDELRQRNQALDAQIAAQAVTITSLQAALAREVADRRAYADAQAAAALDSARTYSDARLAPVSDKLVHVSRNGNNLFVTGANLHVRNGMGATSGLNGLGNLVVGYNESRGQPASPDVRTGSHNIVTGTGSNFSRHSAFITGVNNSSNGIFASVLGGTGNVSSGNFAVVVGGFNNQSTGNWATILGGRDVVAPGQLSRVP